MPLHRDIHWIGRQWAVTGHGMQLIDQKQNGLFDIDIPRLWDEAVIEGLRVQQWVDVADFDKGLDVARMRYTDKPPVASASPIAPTAPVIVSVKPIAKTPASIAQPAELPPQKPEMNESAKPALGKFNMRFSGCAKFVRPWRVRMKK